MDFMALLEGITSLLIGQYRHHMTLCTVKDVYKPPDLCTRAN